jgi:hypothetical protein
MLGWEWPPWLILKEYPDIASGQELWRAVVPTSGLTRKQPAETDDETGYLITRLLLCGGRWRWCWSLRLLQRSRPPSDRR